MAEVARPEYLSSGRTEDRTDGRTVGLGRADRGERGRPARLDADAPLQPLLRSHRRSPRATGGLGDAVRLASLLRYSPTGLAAQFQHQAPRTDARSGSARPETRRRLSPA